jgi:hypothetical protein
MNSPQLEWKVTRIPDITVDGLNPQYRGCLGVMIRVAARDDGNFEMRVVNLDDLGRTNGRGALTIPFPRDMEGQLTRMDVDVDDFSGRVVLWGWSTHSPTTVVFVGELV